jgi:hypothetical protein
VPVSRDIYLARRRCWCACFLVDGRERQLCLNGASPAGVHVSNMGTYRLCVNESVTIWPLGYIARELWKTKKYTFHLLFHCSEILECDVVI